VRYKTGEKIRDFHIPTTLDDYRAVYKAYLHDPDLQDARARWPFVCMWDNHEFSWLGWQSIQEFFGTKRPAQKVKVMANQAFWEFRPTRAIDRFIAPRVENVVVDHFDDHGLGQEPNNLAAIRSLKGHRALRFGRNVELIITDQHSWRSEDPSGRAEAKTLADGSFPDLVPEEALQILDAGRTYGGGNPPTTIQGSAGPFENFRATSPPQTVLGAEQKAWFLDRLKRSKATWKIWGSTGATLDMRADPQNLPAGMTRAWWGSGYAGFGGGDPSSAYVERAEIYDFVRDHAITGFATVAGDRHSFWAGLASKTLPPAPFSPVGVAFVTGSISAPGILEALEHSLPKDHPLRALYVPALNMLLRHGVRSCLEYAKSGDIAAARAQTNPDLSPHLSFVDMGGHGYATVTARSDAFDVEFVCIPRPAERAGREDGGPLAYRVRFRAPMWKAGEKPELAMRVVEGDPKFSI
jgi:alkaline phosphatase D